MRVFLLIVTLISGCSSGDEKGRTVTGSLQISSENFAKGSMNMQTDNQGNPILTQFSEEGFVDLTFRITNLVEGDEHYRFHLSASHKDRMVGMDVMLKKDVQGGLDADMNLIKDHVYRRGVQFLRSGEESDGLMMAIAELYGVTKLPGGMVDQETFTAIALQQGNLDIATEPVKLKLFGKDEDRFVEDDYYESFFNVDLSKGLVYWNEKDSEYREPLLRALCTP